LGQITEGAGVEFTAAVHELIKSGESITAHMYLNPGRLVTVSVRKLIRSPPKVQRLHFFRRDDNNCASDEEIAADFDGTAFRGASFNFSSSL